MPVFEVPIIRTEVAKALDAYWAGEDGLGPKVAFPNVQPKIVKVAASSKREAAILAQKSNPGWLPHQSNIMKARNA